MAAETEENTRIGRDAKDDEHFVRYVMCLNIANAAVMALIPLCDRIDAIAERINASPHRIDVLFVLEAGRPSRDTTWTEMAADLERQTGLDYMGVWRINATPMSFGKAVFVRRSTMGVYDVEQEWTSLSRSGWSGDYFGNDCLNVQLHPVVDEHDVFSDKPDAPAERALRVIRDRSIIASVFHFPMQRDSREQVSEWVSLFAKGEVLFGDFNTFEDDGGPEMIKKITEKHYVRKAIEAPFTFNAFPHDTIRKPAEFRAELNEHSTIEKVNEDGSLQVRFASTLDHLFYTPGRAAMIGDGCFILPMKGATDHEGLVAEIIF